MKGLLTAIPGDRHRDLMEQKVQGLCDIMSMDEYLIIVSTDWEDRYFCNHLIDKACLTGIIVSVLYFLPFMIYIVQK